MQPTSDPRKRDLRLATMASRLTMSRAGTAVCDSAIVANCLALECVGAARCLFVFIGVGQEVDTRGLIAQLQVAGTRILVPRVLGAGQMLAVEFTSWAALERGALGIPRPRSTEDHSREVDTAIVPALAFTRQGYRLGYGGGYYDRWLARNPAAVRVGVCRDNEVRDSLPTDAHDEPVDLVVTNAGVYRCGMRPAPGS